MCTYEETIDRLTADRQAERQPDAPTLRGAAEQARQASEQLTQDTPGISPTRENNR